MSGLRITNATLGTVTLHDASTGVYGQLEYTPTPSDATPSQQDSSGLSDGGEVPVILLPNVSETAEIYLDSGSQAALETAVRLLNSLFEQARAYQRTKAGGPVYVEYRTGNTGNWLRSELLFGTAKGQTGSLNSWMLPAGRIKLTLSWTRRYYWEDAQTYLALSNGHGTTSAGLQVDNTNDATYDNHAQITTTIAGDLPAPCILEYTNTTAGAAMGDLLIGHHAIAQPSVDDLVLDTNSMASTSGTPSTSTGTYNAGNIRTWSFNSTAQQQLGYWNLPTALLLAGLGLWYRVIARIPTSSQAYQIRVYVRVNNLSPLYDGPWTTPYGQRGLVDLGSVQLPPYLRGVSAGSFAALTLGLEVRPTTGPIYSVDVDCLHLVPTESWRMLRENGYGLPTNSRLVDDQILGQLYTDNGSGGSILGNYQADGSPIFLRPARTNRLVLLCNTIAGGAAVNRTGTLRVAYRPRYRFL